ncbi:hypothetical protein NC651_036144 [Populus alba x Populus x berolinensis]|nr:hypothetical protein NC651_036140 [Populus alba x Populus x berolinensis]KAJ6859755.1 hypothetical protein NC651_036144 [Populus alba x Populus x berolinensis]
MLFISYLRLCLAKRGLGWTLRREGLVGR